MYSNYEQHLPRSLIMDTLIRRRQDPEYVTEILHEVGTTRETIGDETMAIMLTTPGEIPDEMYDLETSHGHVTMAEHRDESIGASSKKGTPEISGFASHSTLFTVLLIALLLLVLICCLSACVIARARRRQVSTSDMECDPSCGRGIKQPLIRSDRMSDTTSKSSVASSRR